MKIAGLTWWRNNYGSILQAYALQQVLSKICGLEYEIINQYGKRIISADNFIDKIRSIGIIRAFKRAFWKVGVRGLRDRNKNIQKFVDQHLNISEKQFNEKNIKEANKYYDGFICGSDQIWNPTLIELGSMYWLGFAEEGKIKVAYAPSIGVKILSGEERSKVKMNLSSFNAISCREQSGTELINDIIGDKCCTVLDPVMLINREYWDIMTNERMIHEPYIFVYLLRGTKSQRQMVERFARNRGLKIVTIPFLETEFIEWYDIKFGDIKIWDCGPAQFINAVRYAKYVFTDSFHSTVFSCLYHVKFFVFPKIGKAQNERITGLTSMLEIPGRIIADASSITTFEEAEIDWTGVDEIINKKRAESERFLFNALSRNPLRSYIK